MVMDVYYLQKTGEYGENSKDIIFQIPISYNYGNYNYPGSDSEHIRMIRCQWKFKN